MYDGRATHPVFAALAPTVREYGIPRQPFSDLIDAFVQDQTVTRYRELGRALRLLPQLRQPGGTAGALPVRLQRRRRASA